MKLEQQVTSLELSKQLKTLGVKQESLFYWVKGDSSRSECPDCKRAGGLIPECFYCGGTGKAEPVDNYYLYSAQECFKNGRSKDYSAFTVSELGEILPEAIFDKRGLIQKTRAKGWKGWLVSFDNGHYQEADTEANARAKCLIYLLENKLITL